MDFAIVAVVIPQPKGSVGNAIKKLFVINTNEYGYDDYSIIKAVENNIVMDFHVKNINQVSTGIQMNIIKRDTTEYPDITEDEICAKFLLDEVFDKYM